MEVGTEFRARIGGLESLSRWERSELGKDLRRLGLSYGEIMDLIPVKKSTLATWCREIRLTEEQYAAIKARRAQEPGIPRDTQRKRHREIERIRSEARAQVPVLMKDPLWVAGTILYWAEGAKTRNHLRLNNSDPRALRLSLSRGSESSSIPKHDSACNSTYTRATTSSLPRSIGFESRDS